MLSMNFVADQKENKSTKALEKSKELITAISHESSLRISRICQEVNISERMLQYAYLQRFGVGPKEYIKNYRLRMIRRKLMHGTDFQHIYQVASEFGYWHMGQFSIDYKTHFNELPSQTISKYWYYSVVLVFIWWLGEFSMWETFDKILRRYFIIFTSSMLYFCI